MDKTLSARLSKALIAGLTALALTGTAHAQAADPVGNPILTQVLFFVPLILIFYFLIIRPQSQQRKRHAAMVGAMKRGDKVVTAGGLVGKVTKVEDTEAMVEIADGVRVKVVRSTLLDVQPKGAPVAANDAK